MQYFNHYAFVHVAMYGKSFTQAGPPLGRAAQG